MTLTLTRPGPDPDWPTNPPFPPTGPQFAEPRPDDMPTPWNPPGPGPKPQPTKSLRGRTA